ncbi:hypothetical protein ACQEV4_18455 [Streptomyces shenzhenensis]
MNLSSGSSRPVAGVPGAYGVAFDGGSGQIYVGNQEARPGQFAR